MLLNLMLLRLLSLMLLSLMLLRLMLLSLMFLSLMLLSLTYPNSKYGPVRSRYGPKLKWSGGSQMPLNHLSFGYIPFFLNSYGQKTIFVYMLIF